MSENQWDCRKQISDCRLATEQSAIENLKSAIHQKLAPSAALTSGDNSAVAPPVPIPNTEVKRCSPDGSATIGCARVGRRQNKRPGEVISPGLLLWRRLLEQRMERPG